MAKKDRVPKPPTAPRGPQRRSNASASKEAPRQRRALYLIAGAGAAALAVALAVVFLMRDGTDERSTLGNAGCTVTSFPAVPNQPDHSDVPTLTTKPRWNSNPPTSGPHHGEWAVWDIYDEPVPLVKTVHNLEHGGVVIHYGPQVEQADVEAIRSFYADDPNGLIVAPLPSNADKITLSAWTAPDAATGTSDRGRGWLARCTKFDEQAFSAFIEAHRYEGPERLSPEQLAPGS